MKGILGAAPHPLKSDDDVEWAVSEERRGTVRIWHFQTASGSSGSHDYLSFSKDEARRLIASAGVPLFGRIPPEKYPLPDPDEAMLQRSMFNAGALFNDDGTPLCPTCQRPWDVYDLLETLAAAFARVDMRSQRAFSQANIEHVTTVTKRLRMLLQALEDPSTQLFSGGKPMDDFVRDCNAELAKFTRWANILDRTPRDNGGDQSMADFIRGPLSHCYKDLFDRDAGGNEKGPFARFGVCFFEMSGYKVAPATIARAVKKTPRSAKRKRRLALVHSAE